MRTVKRYTVDLKKGFDQTLEIPGGGHFLFLKAQEYDDQKYRRAPIDRVIDLWYAIDTDNVPVEVELHVRATDTEVPHSVTYLGSTSFAYDVFVHVWAKDRAFEEMHIVDGKFVPKSQ